MDEFRVLPEKRQVLRDAPALTIAQINSALPIEFCGRTGTCFLWGDARGSFFFTAKHVLAGAAEGDKFFLYAAGATHRIGIQEIVFGPPDVDAAAFATNDFQANTPPYVGRGPNVLVGQRVLFAGYPHGLTTTYPNGNKLPSPLVRSATFSGAMPYREAEIMVLDGFNNPGYSGGPVWSASHFTGDTELLGLISGYRPEIRAHSRIYRVENGVEIDVPGTFAQTNSGMIYAVPRQRLEDISVQLKTRNPANERELAGLPREE